MPRTSALAAATAVSLVLAGAFASQAFAQAFAQLVPPAGSAGAGSSAISGIPTGPANPGGVSDPSGIGNAGRMAPLGTNAPAPATSYGSVNSSPPSASRSRVVMPSQTSERPRFSARNIERQKPVRKRGRAQTSSFTGICRGC